MVADFVNLTESQPIIWMVEDFVNLTESCPKANDRTSIQNYLRY